MTADPALLDDMLRLAAVAGIEVDVAHDPTAARRGWGTASLVLLGDDLSEAVGRAVARRRDDVVVVVQDDVSDPGIWRRAVDVGAEQVVALPDGDDWVVDRLVAATADEGRSATSIGVVGGRGGAGASTLAAALALTATRDGLDAVLVDLDPLGGGLDLLLGAEDQPGARWSDLSNARGRVDSVALRQTLPRSDGLRFVSWDRAAARRIPSAAARSVLTAVGCGSELVVLDVGRGLDEPADDALGACDLVVLVVPAQVRAVAAAGRVVSALGHVGAPVELVVREAVPDLDPDWVADALGLPLAGVVREQSSVARRAERGDPPVGARGPLVTVCRQVLSRARVASVAAA